MWQMSRPLLECISKSIPHMQQNSTNMKSDQH